jgi:hypothetical protein
MSLRWWARRIWVRQPVEISSPLSVAAAAAVARTAGIPTVLLVVLACLAIDGGFAALTTLALRAGEKDEAALRAWLRRTLESG